MTEGNSGNQSRAIAINLGDAKIGKLKIRGMTTVGDIDGIKANKPEIDEADISNTLHIQQISGMSPKDAGLLMHNLNILKADAPEIEDAIAVVEEAVTTGNIAKSTVEKSIELVTDFLSAAKDKVTSELLAIAWDALTS